MPQIEVTYILIHFCPSRFTWKTNSPCGTVNCSFAGLSKSIPKRHGAIVKINYKALSNIIEFSHGTRARLQRCVGTPSARVYLPAVPRIVPLDCRCGSFCSSAAAVNIMLSPLSDAPYQLIHGNKNLRETIASWGRIML